MAIGETRNFSAKGWAKRQAPDRRFRVNRIADLALDIAVDLDEGMIDRRRRIENARLAVGEHLVPCGQDQLARHQQTRRIEIRLPLDGLFAWLERQTTEGGAGSSNKETCAGSLANR